MRLLTRREPASPIRQGRRMEGAGIDRHPTGRLPSQIERNRLDGLPIRRAMQGLQHNHRRHHIRRDRRPTPTRGEQVLKHRHREQAMTMLSQKTQKHAARRQQMPSHRIHIQQIPLLPRPALHTSTVSAPDRSTRKARFVQQAPRKSCPCSPAMPSNAPTTTSDVAHKLDVDIGPQTPRARMVPSGPTMVAQTEVLAGQGGAGFWPAPGR